MPADSWVSQHEAASQLGMSVLRVSHLGTKDDLEFAHSPDGERGFTRASVDELAEWRRRASFPKRLLRGALGWLGFL